MKNSRFPILSMSDVPRDLSLYLHLACTITVLEMTVSLYKYFL